MKIGDEVTNKITGQKVFVLIPDYKNTDCEGQMIIINTPQIVAKDDFEITGYNNSYITELVQELKGAE